MYYFQKKYICKLIPNLGDLTIFDTKIKRERAKTPKFCACGGLKGRYNSLIEYLYVKRSIVITFSLKSPRSGEIFLECFFGKIPPEGRKFFGD